MPGLWALCSYGIRDLAPPRGQAGPFGGLISALLAHISPAGPLSIPLASWVLPTSGPSHLLFPLPEPLPPSPPAPLCLVWLTCPHPGSNVHPFWGCPLWSKAEEATPTPRSDQISHSVVSDSLRPQESQHARPPCPSPTPRVHSDSCPSSQ